MSRGGKRVGAGRPRLNNKIYKISIPQDVADFIEKHRTAAGRHSVSELITLALRHLIKIWND